MFEFVYSQNHRKYTCEEEIKKEPKDYRRFVFIEPDTLLDTSVNKETTSSKPSIVTESQEVQTKSQEV